MPTQVAVPLRFPSNCTLCGAWSTTIWSCAGVGLGQGERSRPQVTPLLLRRTMTGAPPCTAPHPRLGGWVGWYVCVGGGVPQIVCACACVCVCVLPALPAPRLYFSPPPLQWIDEALGELGIKCKLEATADGSGLGAAVIAAVSSKL